MGGDDASKHGFVLFKNAHVKSPWRQLTFSSFSLRLLSHVLVHDDGEKEGDGCRWMTTTMVDDDATDREREID
jgi:hypothetical protein